MTTILILLLSINSCYFLKLSPGVMSQGLGGCSIMLDEGLAAFHNPALIEETKFNFTLSRWLYAVNLLAFGSSFGENSIGLSYLNYGSIQGFDEFGISTREFTPYDFNFTIGRKFGHFGIVTKLFDEQIDTCRFWGVCFGLSTYLDFNNLSLGVKFDNLGKEFSKSFDIPFSSIIGLMITLTDNLAILAESKAPDLEIMSGIKYKYQNMEFLFGSKYMRNNSGSSPSTFNLADLNLSAGIVLQVEIYQIGYSFVYTQFSTAHQFSITLIP